MTKRSKSARRRRCSNSTVIRDSNGLLQGLPEELLQLVLDRLAPEDLVVLLHTSKVMAQHVMQHRSGKLQLRLCPVVKRNWEAIGHLLQWAPPASLKLKMQCPANQCRSLEKPQIQLSKETLHAQHSMLGMLRQQLPCLVKLSLQGLFLTSVVPPGLVTACPNLHTLQLEYCNVDNGSNDQLGSSCSSGTSGDRQPACSVHTLMLKDTKLSEMWFPKEANVRMTRAKHQAHVNAIQLRDSLPQLSCLHLEDPQPNMDLAELWGPQLKELHLPWAYGVPVMLEPCINCLQHLQKLVLPMAVAYGYNMEQLLKLRLHHLELETIDPFTAAMQDLSSHPCTWRFLKLHLTMSWLPLEALACIPLHSLQAPLELGRQARPGTCVQVELPDRAVDNGLTHLQALIPRLQQCGVVLKADALCWREYGLLPLDEQQQAAALAAISPVFGTRDKVVLHRMPVGHEMIEALAATHRHTLKCLSLERCQLEDNMEHTVLTQLPALSKLELIDCLIGITVDGVKPWVQEVCATCRRLSEVMVQQPARSELEVLVRPAYMRPDALQTTNAWSLALQQCMEASQGTISIKMMQASRGPYVGYGYGETWSWMTLIFARQLGA